MISLYESSYNSFVYTNIDWYPRCVFVLFGWAYVALCIKSHIATMPTCSSGPQKPEWYSAATHATPRTRDMAFHRVTLSKHRADLWLCSPLMLDAKPDATTTCLYLSAVIHDGINVDLLPKWFSLI